MTDPVKTNVKEKFAKLAEESELGEKKEAVESKKEETEQELEVKRLSKECDDILKAHGGLESNVPINHGYWGMRNQVRALLRPF